MRTTTMIMAIAAVGICSTLANGAILSPCLPPASQEASVGASGSYYGNNTSDYHNTYTCESIYLSSAHESGSAASLSTTITADSVGGVLHSRSSLTGDYDVTNGEAGVGYQFTIDTPSAYEIHVTIIGTGLYYYHRFKFQEWSSSWGAVDIYTPGDYTINGVMANGCSFTVTASSSDYPGATPAETSAESQIEWQFTLVPEPTTMMLLTFGGLVLIRRKRQFR